MGESGQRRGPRGGRTTVTSSGMVKKNLWVPAALAEELRQRAFEERRAEAAIVREALRRYLGKGGREREGVAVRDGAGRR